MILGATYGDIVSFVIVLGVSLALGVLNIPHHSLVTITKSRILRFIYDFIYAIIIGGIFVYVMLRLNAMAIKYYHVLALIIGVYLTGILPVSYLKRYDERLIAYANRIRARARGTRLYRIITR